MFCNYIQNKLSEVELSQSASNSSISKMKKKLFTNAGFEEMLSTVLWNLIYGSRVVYRQTFSCSKSTIETLEKGVKYVYS